VGISREGDLLDLAVNNIVVEKSGSWFSYKSDRIGQGRENARQFLKENKDFYARIESEVKKALGITKPEPSPAPPSPPEVASAKSVAGKK
jgi:recombination protein RecA